MDITEVVADVALAASLDPSRIVVSRRDLARLSALTALIAAAREQQTAIAEIEY